MSFKFKDDDLLGKYNEIWDKIKGKLNIEFHSMPVYDEKYIKAKVREFNGVIKTNFLGVIKTNFLGDETIDSVMRMEKKGLSTGLLRRMQIQNEENKDD